MVLPLQPQHLIRPVFRKLQVLVRNDNDIVSAYSYFHNTWITGFPIELWCQNMSQFRTNNFAESFHASLSRRDVPCHPAFYTFLKRIIRIIQESKTELEVEKQNPKTRRSKECVGMKVATLIDNYVHGPPLALEDFLQELFRVLHAKSAFEEVFEDDKSQDDTESSEVPMELADDE